MGIARYDFEIEDYNVEVRTNQIGDSCEISIDPIAKEDAYAYLFQPYKADVSMQTGILLSVKNRNDVSMQMKFHISDDAWRDVHIADNACYFLKEHGSSLYQQQNIEEGYFELPAAFEGDVYLPLDDLWYSDTGVGVTVASLDHIQGIALTLVPRGKEEQKIELEPCSFWDEQAFAIYEAYGDVEVSFEDTLEIPLEGESMAILRVDCMENSQASYSLLDTYPGVSMNLEGEIYVTSEAKSGDVLAQVILDDTISYTRSIMLRHVLDDKPAELDVEHYCLTKASEREIDYDLESFESIYYYSGYIRLFVMVIVLGLVFFYLNTSKKLEDDE